MGLGKSCHGPLGHFLSSRPTWVLWGEMAIRSRAKLAITGQQWEFG